MNVDEINKNLSADAVKDATDERKLKAMCDVLRRQFERKNAIERAAQMVAEREIQPKSKLIYITVESISLDDDPDSPTVTVMARENWQGNYEDHMLVIPLSEFVPIYLEAVAT